MKRSERIASTCIDAASVKRLGCYPVAELAPHREKVFVHVEFTAGAEISRNEHLFCEFKKCTLLEPEIRVEASEQADGFEVRLSASHPAFWVNLNAQGIPGIFEDNGFTLLPDEPRTVRFSPREPGAVSLQALRDALTVESLRSTYS